MGNKKEIFRISIILFLITAVSALILAFANKVTAPLIEKNQNEKIQISMKSVMKDANKFEEIPNTGDSQCYRALNQAGETIGVCVINSANGYGGEISVMTGINADNTVSGVDILSNSETPGLGANSTKEEFRDQYKGKKDGIAVARGNAADNEINAISGATITSKAVTGAVNEALAISEKILGEGK